MVDRQIRELLKRLEHELERENLDSDTRTLMGELRGDIHALLDAEEAQPETESLVERAKSLEAQFATEYPAAEGFMREVIDALVRMGI